MSAFEPYPVGGRSTSASKSTSISPAAPAEATSSVEPATGPDAPFSNARPAPASSLSGPTAEDPAEDAVADADDGIEEETKKERENGEHWAPGGKDGDGTEFVVSGGSGHGEAEGYRTQSRCGVPNDWAPGAPIKWNVTPTGRKDSLYSSLTNNTPSPASNSLSSSTPSDASGTSPNGASGAIGLVNSLDNTPLNTYTAARDVENGDGNFGRLENKDGGSVEEMEKMVADRLSRLDQEEDDDTNAFLQTELRGNYKQRDFLDDKVSVADEHAQRAYRHFVIHLLNCACKYSDEWHHMHSEDVLKDKLPGGRKLGSTSVLWDFENSVVESRNDGEYVRPARGLNGSTREYRIDSDFAIEFWKKAEGADPNYKLHEENRESGKRARGSAALSTELTDDSGHRWGKERNLPTGHHSLLDGALRVLSETEHKIDISEITDMKEILREEYETAVSQLGQAKAGYKKYAHLDEARTEKEAKEMRKARSKVQAAETRKEEAEGRYHALLSGLEVITRQVDEMSDGVAIIQNAYEVQEISGRSSFRKGGPQGLPAVLKSFAYSMEDVYNYDIKSSQTTGLRQLAEDLRKVGCDVDTEALDTYIDRGEQGGKDWVIDNYDLPRSLVKRVEHAIKFGASIPKSMEQAYHQKENTVWGMPEIASHVEDHFGDREEQNRALDDLNEIFAPQVQMIEDLAEGLLEEYWDAHSYAGGRGKGRVMRNHCGITFCKYDYDGGHEARSKAMAWYLQGLEAAYVHAITILSEEYNYEPMANEHDGLITIGTIPDEAKKRAQDLSGFREAHLTDKRFEDEDEVQAAAEALHVDVPAPPLEDSSEESSTSQTSNTSCSSTQTTNRVPAGTKASAKSPGASVQPTKQETTSGSKQATTPTDSSPQSERKNGTTSATAADDGPNDTTPPPGGEPASPAPEPHSDGGLDVEISDEEIEELKEILPEAGVGSGGCYGQPAGS